jgi:hypothetical protein
MSGVPRHPGKRRWNIKLPRRAPRPAPAPEPKPGEKRRQVILVLAGFLGLVVVLGLLAVLSAVAGSRPRAPALLNEPVYNNTREGFRFLAPEGWTVHSRGETPPGPVDKECLLINYQRTGAEKPAQFEVTLADHPSSSDLEAYLAGPSYGAEKWREKTSPETLDLDGVAATRYVFTARVAKDDLTKEVVAVRRSGRVYFFLALYPSGDTAARDQVRRAVASTKWKK